MARLPLNLKKDPAARHLDCRLVRTFINSGAIFARSLQAADGEIFEEFQSSAVCDHKRPNA